MALQSSGAISLANIQTEFGGSNPISLSEYYGVASGVPSSGTISLSNFYGTSAIAGPGLYEIYSASPTSQTSWSGVFQNIQSYGTFQSQFKLVFRYQNGTSGTVYQGDFQIHNFIFRDTSSTVIYNENFESGSASYQTSTGTAESGTYSSVSSWTSVADGTSSFRWNRDSGGTPSSGTGISISNGSEVWYLYAETSGGSSASGAYYWLRSPTITWNYNNPLQDIIFTFGAYGSNVGTLKVYIEVL